MQNQPSDLCEKKSFFIRKKAYVLQPNRFKIQNTNSIFNHLNLKRMLKFKKQFAKQIKILIFSIIAVFYWGG